MPTPPYPVDDLLDAYANSSTPSSAHVLQVLRQIQARHRFIPPSAIDTLVQRWQLSYAAIRSVIGFYHFLSDTPRGDYTVYLSDSVTDRMLGGQDLMTRLCQRLGVVPGQTRPDGRVSVHATSCTGLCDQGPAGLINGRPLTRLSPMRIDDIAKHIEAQVALDDWPAEWFHIDNPVYRRGPTLSSPIAMGQAIHKALQIGPEAVLQTLQDSQLRGRGGAGFATWKKWQACHQAKGPKAITCNADEGEPGTFKDRMLLMDWAHEVIEGMTVAAITVGAEQGFLYVRGEYEFLAPHLSQVLQDRRQAGWLGARIGGSAHRFDIHIHWGAGAYVCGEETALIESVEGKRGIPRTRPPFPVERGYLGLPTVNNNVETFLQAAQITLHGPDWFKQQGTDASTGTRILSVAGDVARPGLYEIAWGTTVNELLSLCGAQDTQAVLVGGPSGQLIQAQEGHRTVAFEDLATGGAFTVFNITRDMVDIARQYTLFFVQESCGFCTPCRVGCMQLMDTADRLTSGHASQRDLDRLQDTAQLMQSWSHCGLGQTAAHPLLGLIRGFPDQVAARLQPDLHAFDAHGAEVDMHTLRGTS